MNYQKYKKSYYKVPLTKRTWPDKEITKAPIWCSVDLRDGNQALITPMNLEEKLNFFTFLVDLGFKEIEVGFPAASDTEYTFVRTLIDNDLIPDDVTIQVLTQSRPHIIEKTFAAIDGAKNVIVHLYNSVSTLQRRVVFKSNKAQTIELAVTGAKQIKELSKSFTGGNLRFEYSPESFTCTEMDFAAEICNAVLDILEPSENNKVIINLPSTIEVSTPNIYADMIEYMCGALKYRENVVVSLHAHNDRGCGIAATELGILAGADRVEGTLFGNGERTGNADILVIALNMFLEGIDPKLELSKMNDIIAIYEKCSKMEIHPRHPYAGELVYTAFSGSHQDAIKKSMDYYDNEKSDKWENPYLPIDPSDLGREYEPVRINSQSGKGGINFILSKKFGILMPKAMLQEFSYVITKLSDTKQSELSPNEIYGSFLNEYVNQETNLKLENYKVAIDGNDTFLTADFGKHGQLEAKGNGPLDAISNAIRNGLSKDFEIMEYHEHAIEKSSSSKAASYISIKSHDKIYWGAGIDTNINTASIKALISAVNRMN